MSRRSLAPILRQTLRKISSVILSLIIGLSGLAAAAPLMSGTAQADSYDVCAAGCTYSDIQMAVNNTPVGGTVTVGPGTYTENVVVNKSITLEGAGAAVTTITATDANHTPLTFATNGATVSGFTITHDYTSSELSAWNFNNNGVLFNQLTSGNTLENSTVTLNRNGIYLNRSSAAIVNDTITNNRTGINLTNTVDGTSIEDDQITGNWTLGIVYYSQGYATDFSTVTVSGNTLDNWYTEVEVKDAGSSTGTLDVTNNTFADSPVTYTTSDDSSLNEPGFTAQQPVVLGGAATEPASALPTLRIYDSSGVTLAYTSGKTLEVGASEPYSTIQSAIDDATAGDTIAVASGIYNGGINITKSLSLVGQSEAGVIVNETTGTPFGQGISIDGVSNVSISNMTVNTPSGAPVSYALQAYQAPHLSLTNLTFNGPGKTGRNSSNGKIGGIDVNSSSNVSYDAVSVNNYSKNGFSVTSKYVNSDVASANISFSGVTADNNNWAGLAFYTVGNDHSPASTGGSGSITGVTFSGKNTFTNNSQGMFIEGDSDANFGSSAVPRFSVSGSGGNPLAITGSVFSGNTQAIVNYQAGALDASLNYWNSASGPASGQVADGFGAVTTTPYYISSDMTVRSDAKVAPDTNGNATVDNSTPQVVVTDPTQPVTITVSSGTNNASLDFSSLVTNGTTTSTATLPKTVITSSAASVSIPASTVVTANDPTWNGVINAPTVLSNSSVTIPTPSGSKTTVATAIEVGADNISLTFSSAVRLLLPGQAGQLVGFVRNGDFTQISTACTADDQATVDAQLSSGGDCYTTSSTNSADMVVWTKHFTTFVAYSQAAQPASSSSTSTTHTTAASASSPQSGSGDTEVLGATSTPSTSPSTSSMSTSQPSAAEAFQPPAKSSGKFLGIAWYIWLIGIAAIAAASYLAYAYRSVDKN